ncbi:hypothetical protein T484DRAFT_1839925 [Baffinella frigidus]|nr:hypothetical protein T484DRAFT_1839925 [Cryptophyta sp. CCMP2293]
MAWRPRPPGAIFSVAALLLSFSAPSRQVPLQAGGAATGAPEGQAGTAGLPGAAGGGGVGNGTFDREAALLMLNFSRVTYCDEPAIQNWTCPACGNLPGFEAAFVSHERWRHVGCYVGYDKSRDYIVVAFRGTEYLANWVQDLEYIKMDGDYQECDKAAEKAALESGVDSGDNAWLGGGALSRVARTLGLHRAKRKCKVRSGFNEDWKSVREKVDLS